MGVEYRGILDFCLSFEGFSSSFTTFKFQIFEHLASSLMYSVRTSFFSFYLRGVHTKILLLS